jgi:hypothetical protein
MAAQMGIWASRLLALTTAFFVGAQAFAASTCESELTTIVRDHLSAPDLYISHIEASTQEHAFKQNRDVSGHIIVESQEHYVVSGYAAENTGFGLWFDENLAQPSSLGKVQVVRRGPKLWGSQIALSFNGGQTEVVDNIMGSIRFWRDRELNVMGDRYWRATRVELVGAKLLRFTKTSLDGNHSYIMELEALNDTKIETQGGRYRLTSVSGSVRAMFRTLSDVTPLTNLSDQEIWTEEGLKKVSKKDRDEFRILMHVEKQSAGSPRYLSNFLRDRLTTLRALFPYLKPEMIENILASVLGGADPRTGMTSHEQSEGDFTAWMRIRRHQRHLGQNDPMEDRKMTDGEFLFTILYEQYASAHPTREKAFLDRLDRRGRPLREVRNAVFDYVRKKAEPFAKNPIYTNLVRFKGDEPVGNMRDSENGVARGKYAFDVNAALVPGALHALMQMSQNPKSELYNSRSALEYQRMFDVWNTRVIPFFEVRIAARDLRGFAQRWFSFLGIPVDSLPPTPTKDLVFPAISLDDSGRPIPVMHSDDTMMMAFGFPSDDYVKGAIERGKTQFPYGLNSGVGLLISNAVFAPPDIQVLFTNKAYHGLTIWGLHEKLWMFGARRMSQMKPKLHKSLSEVAGQIRQMIIDKLPLGNHEVFALDFEHGQPVPRAFKGDAKSNLIQLWSLLMIAEFNDAI